MTDEEQINILARFLKRNYYEFGKEHEGEYWCDIIIALIQKLDEKNKDNIYINNEGAELAVKVINDNLDDKIERKVKDVLREVTLIDGRISGDKL